MSIEIKDVFCKPFGKCVLISNSVIDVYVTVDKGPRIIHFGFSNEKNLLFNKNAINIIPMLEINPPKQKIDDLDEYSGHRLLLKEYPTKNTIPMIDDQPVVYSILPKGIKFTPPYEELQSSIEITLSENTNNIMVLHSVKNLSSDTKNLALCAATSFPGEYSTLIVPQNESGLDVAPNRVISLWPYSKINDKRLTFFDKYIIFSPNLKDENLFRLGINNNPGWVTFLHQDVAIFKRFVHNSKAKYLNGVSSLEFFAVENFLTVETLSPVFEIGKNEIARHAENWSIFKTDTQDKLKNEDQIEKFLNSIK